MLNFKYLIINFLVLLSYSLFGQEQSRMKIMLNSYIEKLKANNIMDIGYFNEFCAGYNRNRRDCGDYVIYEETFLFWRTGDQTCVKKFDSCYEYDDLLVTDTCFFEYYNANRIDIKNDAIKQMETMIIEGKDTLYYISLVDHTCKRIISIFDQLDTIVKYTNDYDLEKDNIHYLYNHNLKLVTWDKQIKRLTSKLNSEFKRIN